MPTIELSAQHREFQDRIRRIQKSHAAMSQGVVFRVDADGIIRPEARRHRRSFAVARVLLIVVAVLFVLKAFMVESLDEATYAARLATLEAGNAVEKAGAVVMEPDPASQWLALQIGRLLR